MAVVFWIFYNGSQVLHRLLIMFSYAGSTDLDVSGIYGQEAADNFDGSGFSGAVRA